MNNEISESWLQQHQERAARSSAGMAAKVEAGGYPGAAPLGYRNIRTMKGTSVEVDEEIAPLIKLAFEMLGQHGASLRSVLATVSKLGLKTKNGTILSLSSFQLMVTNPFYAGLIRYQGRLHAGNHLPIIAERLFWQIQGQLMERRKRPVT